MCRKTKSAIHRRDRCFVERWITAVKKKSHYDSPLGGITLIADETALLGLWFDWQPGYADDDSAVLGDSPTIDAAKRWLDEYFAGCIPRIEVPLRLEGTPFRKEAWALLRKVPYGETVSYGGLARRLELKRADGRRVSARAIGGAVHRNPIALIVPCHRVVGADGSLTGYPVMREALKPKSVCSNSKAC